jgi:Na+-driven multidrug efflux pump
LIVLFLIQKNKSFAWLTFKDLRLYQRRNPRYSQTWHSRRASVLGFLDQQRLHSSLGQWLWGSTPLQQEISVAGNSASIQIEGYIWIVMNSFSTAVVAIVAQNYGAGNKENIKKALWMSLASSTVLGLALGGIAVLLPIGLLLGIFLTGWLCPRRLEPGRRPNGL